MVYVLSSSAATQAVLVTDFVSAVSGSANECGAFTYTISNYSAERVLALMLSDLTISSSGVISLQTADPTMEGIHTVLITASLASYAAVFST